MQDLPDRETLLLQQVWDDYVQRMVARKGDSQRYPLERTRVWLSWLAQQMREHNQTVFYLEHLQPDWLSARQQRTYAWRAVRLPAICIGALMGILVQLFFFGGTQFLDLGTCLQYGVLGGFLGGVWRGSVSEKEDQGEHRHLWGKHLAKRLAISVFIGLIDGLNHGWHLLSSTPHYTLSQWESDSLSYGVAGALTFLILQYLLLAPPFRSGTSSRHSAPQQQQKVVRFFHAVQGTRALLIAAVIGLSVTVSIGSLYGPSVGLSIALTAGLLSGLISLALNTQMEDIRPTERLIWTWKSLRRGLFNSKHFPITVSLACISIIVFGPSNGLSVALRIGLSYWCLLGLFQGIAQEQIENRNRRITNQGIRRSLHNSVIMGLIGGAVIGSLGILSYWLTLRLYDRLSYKLIPELSYGLKLELNTSPNLVLYYGLGLGISGALLIYMLTGGLAVLRHYTIRLLLWRTHTFPWKAPQFLDDATARFLLRRVGGCYTFIHRLLLDHVADGQTGATPDVSELPTHPLHP